MVMALRASAVGRPPSVPRSPELAQSPKAPVLLPCKGRASSKHQLNNLSLPPAAAAAFNVFAAIAAPDEARAVTIPKEQIVTTLSQVESTIDQIQEFGSKVFSTTSQVVGVVTDAVKPALPVLKQAGEQAVKIASPVVSEASKKAQEVLQSSGIDTEPVITAAKTVADAAEQTTRVIGEAKPIATSTVQTISSAEPAVILGTGGALVIVYFLIPPIFSAISFSLRGYQGDLTATQALDLMSTKNYIMIDIRPEKEKGKAGVPRLPNKAKNKLISIPLEELPNKLKSLVGNVKKVETELLATKISYLKNINKGSNIVILDSYADSAKTVARTLTKLGFKNTFVVADGFSGGKGWLQSRLGADSYNVSFAEVISPSRVISGTAAGGRLGSRSPASGTTGRRLGTATPSPAKLLPGGSD
ncbi:calcium sensing receptor, chloroplastic [Andrographis paniculata]|uniref:calcium sensing receptor, chloroplastic n=1 Tax=Andrographis paniculata TaxID=175694 RepID=UPI0021E8D58F|nr:calcium sensing receptor, chloroplastic [Andrographis paniculata]